MIRPDYGFPVFGYPSLLAKACAGFCGRIVAAIMVRIPPFPQNACARRVAGTVQPMKPV